MWRTLRIKIKRALLAKITTGLIIPFLGALPPVIAAAAALDNPWPKWFFEDVKPWLAKNSFWATVCVFWPAILLPLAYWLRELEAKLREDDYLGQRELAIFMRSLDQPVGMKLERFGKVAHRLKFKSNGSTAEPGAVFQEITKPEEQIRLLAQGVFTFFAAEIDQPQKPNIKVRLARMENRKIVEFEVFLPAGAAPATRPENLQQREAAVNRAAVTKEIVIVPDIAKEAKKKRNYVKGTEGSRNEGSMICFPVVDAELEDVPYVICVKHPEPKHFANAKKQRYEFILQRFAERIAMENRLRIIKKATTNS